MTCVYGKHNILNYPLRLGSLVILFCHLVYLLSSRYATIWFKEILNAYSMKRFRIEVFFYEFVVKPFCQINLFCLSFFKGSTFSTFLLDFGLVCGFCGLSSSSTLTYFYALARAFAIVSNLVFTKVG